MKMLGGSGGNSEFSFKMLMFGVVVLILLPTFITVFCPAMDISEDSLTIRELEEQYRDFTGSEPSQESIWALTGIYTPYGTNTDGTSSSEWGYTPDGWLYGQRVVNYTPSQYGTPEYSATYQEDDGYYYYPTASTTVNKHQAGDLYASVVMDVGKKSNIFFTTENKTERENGQFYYDYTGYRYAFQPVEESLTTDQDGNQKVVVPNTSSLSLIWYDYYGNSGIAGQLIITGSDSGVAYLTSAEIVSAFNSSNSTSKFEMTFNGVDMNVYIRLDPFYLSNGLTVEEVYNLGYWSIMVSSNSIETEAYQSSSYEFNINNIFETAIDLLTFNTSDYGLTGIAGTLASMVIVVPLFIGLICIGTSMYPVLIFAGIWSCLTAWNWGLF